MFLDCDALWLATGVRSAAAVVRTGETRAITSYDGLPEGLTSAERDLVMSFRSLPPRRQKELGNAVLNEASQFIADVKSVAGRSATGRAVAAEKLPIRPDGEQPDTVPGLL